MKKLISKIHLNTTKVTWQRYGLQIPVNKSENFSLVTVVKTSQL